MSIFFSGESFQLVHLPLVFKGSLPLNNRGAISWTEIIQNIAVYTKLYTHFLTIHSMKCFLCIQNPSQSVTLEIIRKDTPSIQQRYSVQYTKWCIVLGGPPCLNPTLDILNPDPVGTGPTAPKKGVTHSFTNSLHGGLERM